jgi:phage terminase large subunit GpA-like protein
MSDVQAVLPPFASVKALVNEGLQLLLPPTRETVDEFAIGHRLLPRKTGTGFDLYTHDEAPYLALPMRTLTSHQYLYTAIVGPAQCGKTAVAENELLHAVAKQPRSMLWYMQTDESLEAYVKGRINPMVEAHQEMRSRLGDRPEDNAQHFKKFDGMRAEFLSFTYNNLINKNAPLIVADEWDAYDDNIGDPKTLLDARRQYYGKLSHLLAISHADKATGLDPNKHWSKGIMRLYADSTRFVWYWPCPHCGAWSSPAPIARRVMTLEWPKDAPLNEVEREAHLLCPVNGCVIVDRERRGMNIAAFNSPFGGWIGQGQEISEDGEVTGELIKSDTAGFWILGVMSNFLLKGMGGLAREWAKAQREYDIDGDDKPLKEVVVKQIGIPHSRLLVSGNVEADTLAERALVETQPLGVVPEGVRFLTAWFDVQPAYFDLMVRGWGIDGESWVIDKRHVAAETATDRKAWDDLLQELIPKRYPLATDPARGMAIRAIGYDSAGSPGTTDQAYSAWRRLREKRLLRNYGRLDGRDQHSVIPTKGASGLTAPMLSVVYPSSQRKDRKVVRAGIEPLAIFNPNVFKDDLMGQLKIADRGPGYVHVPSVLRSKESPHVLFEQMVAETRKSTGQWEKPAGVRNEMLDLMVGTHVLAKLHGLPRIKWEEPQFAWALPWDRNSMVGPITPQKPSAAGGSDGGTGGPPPPPAPPTRTIFDLIG